MATTGQETKTQRVERLKREKNAWERLDEIREFARKGYESIPADWLGTYFRPWGVYTQGDGAGALGGKGGEGKAVPYFMVRIRVSNGLLTRTRCGRSQRHHNATRAAWRTSRCGKTCSCTG